MTGMLMIPKTIAYVAIGLLAYFDFYKPKKQLASVSGHGNTIKE
jgi:hypothetical protein